MNDEPTMERRYRLKKNRAFQYVYRRGHSVACRNLVMLLAPSRELKIGFSVSKKTGNAVTRNRIKRRLQNALLKHDPEPNPDAASGEGNRAR